MYVSFITKQGIINVLTLECVQLRENEHKFFFKKMALYARGYAFHGATGCTQF